MDATRGGTSCYMCLSDEGGVNAPQQKHLPACPVVGQDKDGRWILDPQRYEDWERGWMNGFNRENGLSRRERLEESGTFILGFNLGKREIERLADVAAQHAVWGDEH